ncbi:protein unc-80 [Aphelenchoides avenae]|nr:protein unc-80 [Aphelenchus avenae]
MALRGLLIEKLNEIEDSKSAKKDSTDKPIDLDALNFKRSPIMTFIRNQMLNVVHTPLSTLLKSALVLSTDQYRTVVGVSWQLLLHDDPHLVASAASMFITCAVKCPEESVDVIKADMTHSEATRRTEAVNRFLALWRNRFHVWLKMEDGAQLSFKVPPPGIDFTLPSPPVGQSQLPVVDPPWMPHIKTKVEELSLKEEEHATSQTIMTMTRTRRKQKQELVKRAIREADERQSELRQQFPLRATPLVQQAAYEPALFHHQVNQQATVEGEDGEVVQPAPSRYQMPVAQPLFPSSILSVVPLIVEMMDDVQVDRNGRSVGDVCRRIIWSCITEDPSLFLRHFLEKLTNREKQPHLMSLLRKMILTFKPLPSQTACSMLNYLFGFVMFYVRTPCEGSDRSLGQALSLIWLIAPYVHGLYFKDLKQTLKKEQCDQALMITANVPSAKKVVVHGPDSNQGGIPQSFPIHEDTQFHQILTDSIEAFNISADEAHAYFLVDAKTHLIHNPSAYVRDYYFFHRSFYPQLSLVKLDPEEAMLKMRESAFQHKLIEAGKVLLTHNILKYSPDSVIPQRIFFLHDEFTHLPSFPRRSVESCFGLYQGPMGDELRALDSVHKLCWSQLVSDMFSKMENAFMFGDLHLFINVINGIFIIHCEDVVILRRCIATYLTMSIHFSTLFANQGFFLIMPTILRSYSQRQTNRLFTEVVEFACKQFYVLHRKPFLLQTFGAVAEICDHNSNDLEVNPMQVKAKYLFNLLLAMEGINDLTDPVSVLDLLPYPKPLKAIDLCYREDPNSFNILTDAIASCVTVCAFAPESKRCHQMLLVMQAILPYCLENMELETQRNNNHSSALKHEVAAYTTLCVEMKALINGCEILARGPTRTFDLVNTVSDRGKSFIADSPQFFDPPTVVDDEVKQAQNNVSSKDKKSKDTAAQGWDNAAENTEMQKEQFRKPRDALLTLCAMFIETAGARLKELGKMVTNVEHVRVPELTDHKCYVKLSEIAMSLLKIAPYDLSTLSCTGLQKFFHVIMPVIDWSVETNRSALNVLLRRLDKTISKIAKKQSVRKRANWNAISTWLSGLLKTLAAYPYVAHLHPLKTITQTCLRMTVGDSCAEDQPGTNPSQAAQQHPSTILHSTVPPSVFCNTVLKLTSFLMQALGQFAFSLEFVCSTEGIGSSADRLEAVLCHILIPLLLRSAFPGKDVSQFQNKDIAYILNVIHNGINPALAKASLAPVSSGTLASTALRSANPQDTTGRQGSVSVTDRGHSATVSTHRLIRESVVQSVFLGLKVMILTCHKQMLTHWVKVARIVKDLVGKKIGGPSLFSFIEFLLNVNLPISLLVLPTVYSKINHKAMTEQEAAWQNEFRDTITRRSSIAGDSTIGFNAQFNRLAQELQQMKEDFASRNIGKSLGWYEVYSPALELPRSHTPTIGDLHSDSVRDPQIEFVGSLR